MLKRTVQYWRAKFWFHDKKLLAKLKKGKNPKIVRLIRDDELI